MRSLDTIAACLGVSALLLAACGDSGGDDQTRTPTQAEYDDIATTTGALVSDPNAGEVRAMTQAALIVRGEVPLGFVASGSGHFEGAFLGLTYSYDVACADVDGDAVLCGADADSASVEASWSGTWNGQHLQASASWSGAWTFEDLQADVVLANGEATGAFESDYTSPWTGAQRSWDVTYDAAYDDVAVDVDRGHAVSGTASYFLDVERDVSGADADRSGDLEVDADVRFTADGASVTLDGNVSYTVDADGQITSI